MADSVFSKGSAALHAIAFTLALAIISGYLPIKLVSLDQVQAILQVNLQLHKF